MRMHAQVLGGNVLPSIRTKRGQELPKARLKVMDIGPEAGGGDLYWIDFLGEAALSEDELEQVRRQAVELEVRSMHASAGKEAGKAYLNAAGGAVLLGGQIVQRGLRQTVARSA